MGKEALAFNNEFYKEPINRNQIRDDFVSYLGEYRFEIPEFSYKMNFLQGEIVDPNTKEAMTLKAQKAIKHKCEHGLGSKREEAELDALKKIEKGLTENPFGTIVWFSPPGPKEEGYGDHGFAFIGKRTKGEVNMTAYRLEKANLSEFNKAKQLITGEKDEYSTADDFLSSPWVINVGEDEVKSVLESSFKIPDKKRLELFEEVILGMDKIIEELINIFENGNDEEKLKARYATENYALDYKERLENKQKNNVIYLREGVTLSAILPTYNYEPPKVAGSCGSTGNSSNVLNKLTNSNSLFNENEWFTCPRCGHKADGPIGNTCPGCGITKEQYAAETGEDTCE